MRMLMVPNVIMRCRLSCLHGYALSAQESVFVVRCACCEANADETGAFGDQYQGAINDVVIISHLQQTGFTALSLGLQCML